MWCECPVHWPGQYVHDDRNNYKADLSLALLCDSRHLLQFKNKTQSYNKHVNHSVTAVINKTGLGRYMTLKLIEIFGLDHDIMWSGIGASHDFGEVIQEIDSVCPEHKTQILAPIALQPKWFYPPEAHVSQQVSLEHWIDDRNPVSAFVESVIRDYCGIPRRGSHVWSWNNSIGSMMSGSAVCFITESECMRSKISTVGFSWKSIFTVMAHTIPIWIGARGAADQWRNMGFDVFDDIVNHEYQYAPTEFQRCWQAVYLNQHLLQDASRLRELKAQLEPRFNHNHSLLHQDVLGMRWYLNFSDWPQSQKIDFWQKINRLEGLEIRQQASGIKKYLKAQS
jgi:hypothetical protein